MSRPPRDDKPERIKAGFQVYQPGRSRHSTQPSGTTSDTQCINTSHCSSLGTFKTCPPHPVSNSPEVKSFVRPATEGCAPNCVLMHDLQQSGPSLGYAGDLCSCRLQIEMPTLNRARLSSSIMCRDPCYQRGSISTGLSATDKERQREMTDEQSDNSRRIFTVTTSLTTKPGKEQDGAVA